MEMAFHNKFWIIRMNKISINKENGNGIGLFSAYKYLQKIGGILEFPTV